jgi:hypothetical protein
MSLTEADALRAYAKMMNTLNIEPLEALLADDLTYESQWVFDLLDTKKAFLDYMVPKLNTIARSNRPVFAEMGMVIAYRGKQEPCVILAQDKKTNLVGLVLVDVKNNKIIRLDLCTAPSPQAAERSGEYPV